MAEVHGSCDERFASVRTTFESNLDQGLDVGASVAVFHHGEPVVDLWGGVIDDAGTPWERDTIINVWSTTKTMAALCALMLADRGELDVDAPVSTYWPEFAASGKEGVLIRHVLSHTAGLSGWEEPMAADDLYDWDKATRLLAAQAPWWEPGTASGYHAVTQGYLVGELVRRITGRTIGTFFADEVAGPLGADFHIGTPASADDRVAKVIPPIEGNLSPTPGGLAARTLGNPGLRAQQSWDEAWRRAEIPAAGGHGNARSVAAVQSVVACGGEARGVKLLSEEGCERIFRVQCDGTDLVLGMPLKHGIGYGLPSEAVPLSPSERACYWGGWGGSIVVIDLDQKLCIAYVMNRMGDGTQGDLRGASLVFAAYAALA